MALNDVLVCLHWQPGSERVLTWIRRALFVIIYKEAVDNWHNQGNQRYQSSSKLWVIHINHLYLLNAQYCDLGAS